MTPAQPAIPVAPKSRPALLRFFDNFTVLKGAMRELWVVFIVKFIAIAAYAVTNSTLVLWLSSDLGYSDGQAGWLVAAWSISITAIILVVGSLTDAIGFRKAFFLGTWICIVARTVLVLTLSRSVALAAGLFPLAVGEALGGPVLVASVRTFSNTRQRSIYFSVSYAMMNLGFALAAYLFDKMRHDLGEHGHFSLGVLGLNISTYRALFLVSLVLEIAVLPFLYLIREGAEATEEGVKISSQPGKNPGLPLWKSAWCTARDGARDSLRLFAGLFQQSGFYRLLGFLLLIAFIKLIYKQIDYIYPKFGIRELGDGAPIGKLTMINFLLIIPLAPIVGALTQRFAAYKMVILGGALSSASVFIMALPPAWFAPIADTGVVRWLGYWCLGLQDSVHPYYVMIALFQVVLSFGEAFYSPRVYEYAAAIAPKGQEASYSALSYVPFLLAKVLVGTFSGFLLTNYCPETGPRHSGTLWLFVALTASIAPIGLLALRRYIRVHEAGREE
jgi:MFS family permease